MYERHCYNSDFSLRMRSIVCFFVFVFVFFWLRWVFVAACGLFLVATSGSYSSLQCMGFSLWWLLCCRAWVLGTQASVVAARGLSSCGVRASVVVAHRLSCSTACGIFPDQGSNPCSLY